MEKKKWKKKYIAFTESETKAIKEIINEKIQNMFKSEPTEENFDMVEKLLDLRSKFNKVLVKRK